MPNITIVIVRGGYTRARPGLHCRCTGRLYASSYGDGPGAYLNNDEVYISRVIEDSSRPYPILLGNQWTDQLGWVTGKNLKINWRPCSGPLPRNQGEDHPFHLTCSFILLHLHPWGPFVMTVYFFSLSFISFTPSSKDNLKLLKQLVEVSVIWQAIHSYQ